MREDKMLAFHNKKEVKQFYLDRIKLHQELDEIHQGEYVNEKEKKYCAVGCTLHSSNHQSYETELGIPVILARLEDKIFEGLPKHRMKTWPYEFISVIKIGADLSGVWPKFAVWLLTDDKHGVLQYIKNQEQKTAINRVSDYYSRHKEITDQEWKNASDCAYPPSDWAYPPSDCASDWASNCAAAACAAAAYAAAYAASAAYAAAYAASAAASAAYAAFASNCAAACTADAKNRENYIIAQADKLLELLAKCE